MQQSLSKLLLASTMCVMFAGCSITDRLAGVGSAPSLSAIENPTHQPGYRPVQMPMPTQEAAVYQHNSLWRSGSRAFFKDQRAARVGDILTVKVKVTDQAKLSNKTSRSRANSEDAGITAALGVEQIISKALLPNGATTSQLAGAESTSSSVGSGNIDRAETLTTNMAAVVTQVLPNQNLVLEGRQEIRVNNEVRELIVAGIVRPEDIESDNTIESAKIAEARISYGGRGQITDVQQPRYGQQVMDILLPF